MPKNIFITIIVVLFILLGAVTWFGKREKIENVANFEECAAAGNPVMESFPRMCRAKDGRVFVEKAEATDPTLWISSPTPGETIRSPFTVSGQATGPWFFEGSFTARLLDGNGSVLGTAILQAEGDWMTTDLVPFKGTLVFENPSAPSGFLVFQNANPSGLPENAKNYQIQVNFSSGAETAATTTVKLFFANSIEDPNTLECDKTYPAERSVPKTLTPLKTAITELLKGTTPEEENAGFRTQINSGVILKSATIIGGVAHLDFDSRLQFEVGGSCRVASIRSQIEETVKQFPSVKSVKITVDGEEEILQP